MRLLLNSVFIAFVVFVAVALWILSGQSQLFDAEDTAEAPPQAKTTAVERPLPRVQTYQSEAIPFTEQLVFTGMTTADRKVDLRAEMPARVEKIFAKEGQKVAAGFLIMHLDDGDLNNQKRMAEARLTQRQIEFDAAQQLAAKGFQARTRKAKAEADLRQAEASLAGINERISDTRIIAPFGGIISNRPTEVGSYLKAGDVIATLLDLDPIVITASVPERDYLKIKLGQMARATLIDGSQLDGEIRFIAASSDPTTRTFRIEIVAENPDGKWAEGVTTRVVAALPPMPAHRLSPSILVLGREGQVGLRIVTADGRADFAPIEIVGAGDGWLYVTGLNAQQEIIVVGQDFVKNGQAVDAVPVQLTGGDQS